MLCLEKTKWIFKMSEFDLGTPLSGDTDCLVLA